MKTEQLVTLLASVASLSSAAPKGKRTPVNDQFTVTNFSDGQTPNSAFEAVCQFDVTGTLGVSNFVTSCSVTTDTSQEIATTVGYAPCEDHLTTFNMTETDDGGYLLGLQHGDWSGSYKFPYSAKKYAPSPGNPDGYPEFAYLDAADALVLPATQSAPTKRARAARKPKHVDPHSPPPVYPPPPKKHHKSD